MCEHALTYHPDTARQYLRQLPARPGCPLMTAPTPRRVETPAGEAAGRPHVSDRPTCVPGRPGATGLASGAVVLSPVTAGAPRRFAVSSSGCSSRACPSTSSTSVASRTIAQGYRSHRWAWAGWLHQPCRSGSCPCRRRSGISGPCRDAASSDTNVRNTSAGRGPTGPDDMTGPPSRRRTECRAHQGVPVMRPPTLLPLGPTDTAARQTCAERSGNGPAGRARGTAHPDATRLHRSADERRDRGPTAFGCERSPNSPC